MADEDILQPVDTAGLERSIDRAIELIDSLREQRRDLLAVLRIIKANRVSINNGKQCVLTACAMCLHDIGWPVHSCETPVCDECLIDGAIAKAEGRPS